MRILTRDFTLPEKIILLVLILVLMGLGYYQFIDQPIRRGIEEAHAERDSLQAELIDVQRKITDYQRRVDEIAQAMELRHEMPSYNQSEEELRILNETLTASDQYSLAVDKITLNGNQIRRNFQVSFTAPSFETAKGIFTRLSASPIRCLVGDIECSGVDAEDGNTVNVKANGTFYETRVDAVVDAVLAELIRDQEAAATQAKAKAAAS